MASAPRRSTRARRPLPQPADGATPSTSTRRWTDRARRPLPPPSARRRSTRGPAAQTVYPDEIWAEILLRLVAAADLARASAACSTFRRVVSERWFVRRFRSLHSPPVLGFLRFGCRKFLPVEPPHRSAPQAHALLQAADFTFSFLPDPGEWVPYNARDGRVLLSRRISTLTQFRDFLVCDPLHRRYVKIPRIPDDLLAACTPDKCMATHVLPILAPAAENDGEEAFRVICTVKLQLEDKFMAFVFSSCDQTWRGIISTTDTACVLNRPIAYTPSYAHGRFYWMVGRMGCSLMLDTSEMKFSITELPPHNCDSEHAIVEAEEGRLRFLAIADGTIDLYCMNWQSNGVGEQNWQHDKLIPLPKDYGINYNWSIVGTAGPYVAFRAYTNWYEMQDNEYFVLDMKTLVVEKLCTSNNDAIYGFPYARFPPPLALPSI